MDNKKILEELKQPFNPAAITWKPGSINKEQTRGLALAYADLRAYQNRLDEVCGLGWSVTYTPWGDRIVCHVTISGVTRSSSGEPDSQSEKSEIGGTSAEAQAFKRACAMFGLGRYLYNLPSVWVEYDAGTKQFTDKAKAKLEGIIVQHYRRTMAPDDKSTTVEVSGHEDIDKAVDAIVEGVDKALEEPGRNPDVEWDGIQGALDKKRVAPTKAKGNTFAWPSPDNADAMQMATDILHYEVTIPPVAYDLISKFRGLHSASNDKPLSGKQHEYVAGLVEKITGAGSSPVIMTALTGAYPVLPGWKCKELIDLLLKKDAATLEGLQGVAAAIKEAMLEVA